MCHRRSDRSRTSSRATDEDREVEREDALGWWGAHTADRLRSLVASEREDETRDRPAPEADPTASEDVDDTDDKREKTELIPADD